MSTFQKLGLAVIIGGIITSATLPDRKTAQIGSTFFSGVRGVLATMMGTGKRV